MTMWMLSEVSLHVKRGKYETYDCVHASKAPKFSTYCAITNSKNPNPNVPDFRQFDYTEHRHRGDRSCLVDVWLDIIARRPHIFARRKKSRY